MPLRRCEVRERKALKSLQGINKNHLFMLRQGSPEHSRSEIFRGSLQIMTWVPSSTTRLAGILR